MGIQHREIDNLDRLPPGTPQPGRTAPWAWAWPRWDVVAVLVVGALALLGVLWLLNPIFVYVLFGLFVAGALVRWVLLVGQPGGWRVATRSMLHTPAQPIIEQLIEVNRTYAATVPGPAQVTYSPTMQPARALEVAPTSVAALPDNGAQLVPDAEWLQWMDKAPHLMIAGRTEAGKTTFATALAAERARRGDRVVVLDVHYQPGKWGGLPAIGGGRNFEAVLSVLPQFIRDMSARYEEYERGKKTEDFERLTILIDEVPALVAACMELSASGAPRITDMRWLKFAEKLGSEARKVRISVILMTQSTLVKNILINTNHQEHFLLVGLGDRAADVINGAPANRKQGLYTLLEGQPYPAAMEWKNKYYLLDTSNVPTLAARPVQARAWVPPVPMAAQIPPTERVSPPPNVPTQPMTMTNQDQIIDLLRARPKLTSTEIAKATGIDLNTTRKELSMLYAARKIYRQPTREGNDRYAYSVTPITAGSEHGA